MDKTITPTVFEKQPLVVGCSTLAGGTMKLENAEDTSVTVNRQAFLKALDSSLKRATRLRVGYGPGVVYDRIIDAGEAERGKGMRGDDIAVADAIFTRSPLHALFLPIADCGGAVLYDPVQKALGIAHLGRHSTFDGLAEKAVSHMGEHYGSRPEDILVWIGPAISGRSYWLHTFDKADEPQWRQHSRAAKGGWYVDLQSYNVTRFQAAGVQPRSIERSDIDVATDPRFPSHYAFATLGRQDKAGRFAIAAYMTA